MTKVEQERHRSWQKIRVAFNGALQLMGDPRWWPRDLETSRTRILWRNIERPESATLPDPTTPADWIDRLRALAAAQYDETRLWFLIVTYLYVAGAVLAGLAFLIPSERPGLTFAAVLCQILAAFARIRAARLHKIANEADWRALLLDARGPTAAELERAAFIENAVSDSARGRAGLLPGYYSSEARPGDRRLIEHLRQTAFLLNGLYGGAKVQAYFLSAVVILVALGGPIYTLATSHDLPSGVGILLVTAVLPLWDVIGRQISWREAATTLERVVVSLRTVTSQDDALPLMVEMMTVTAMAPPVPRTVYVRWVRQGLRKRWKMTENEPTAEMSSKPAAPMQAPDEAHNGEDTDLGRKVLKETTCGNCGRLLVARDARDDGVCAPPSACWTPTWTDGRLTHYRHVETPAEVERLAEPPST